MSYEQERVLELNKDVFKVNGHFDKEHIYPGSVVPLMNADGARFNGTITDVKEDTVTVDLNHPLAGKALNFIGEVTETAMRQRRNTRHAQHAERRRRLRMRLR